MKKSLIGLILLAAVLLTVITLLLPSSRGPELARPVYLDASFRAVDALQRPAILFGSNREVCFRIDLTDPVNGFRVLKDIKPNYSSWRPTFPTMFVARPDASGVYIGTHAGLYDISSEGDQRAHWPASAFGVSGFGGYGVIVDNTLLATAYQRVGNEDVGRLIVWDIDQPPSTAKMWPRESRRRFALLTDRAHVILPEDDLTQLNFYTGDRMSLGYATPSTVDGTGDYLILSGTTLRDSLVVLLEYSSMTGLVIEQGGHAVRVANDDIYVKRSINAIRRWRPNGDSSLIVTVGSPHASWFSWNHMDDAMTSHDRTVVVYGLSAEEGEHQRSMHVAVIDTRHNDVLLLRWPIINGVVLVAP